MVLLNFHYGFNKKLSVYLLPKVSKTGFWWQSLFWFSSSKSNLKLLFNWQKVRHSYELGQNAKWYQQEIRLFPQIIINSPYSETFNVTLCRTQPKILIWVFNASNILFWNYPLMLVLNHNQTQIPVSGRRMCSNKGKSEWAP